MKEITWDDFNYKNRNKTGSFEDMCRTLFLRAFKKSGHDFQYNYNQAGLEIEPVSIIEDEQKVLIGLQCKYFTSDDNGSQYKQIYESVEKAIKLYNNRLDRIYIYTNSKLQPKCSDEEIKKTKTMSYRIKLAEININIMKLEWIQQDNIIELIKEPQNNDLRRMYFSNERENDWIDNSISINEKTFLNSTEFFNLKLNNICIADFGDEITGNKVTLILGSAGTGKSVLIKKIFSDLSDEFLDFKKIRKEKSCIPILIKLRECINGDLENLIRQRLSDYNLKNIEKECDYIYFFDGLDEISHYNIGSIISQMQNLIKMPMTKSIIVSSRTDSNNLAYLHQFIECDEYKINLLNYEDIESIFAVRGAQSKIDKLRELKQLKVKIIDEITDIFSANLLWNIINEIDSNTSKIDIIELSVDYWMRNYSKMVQLPLLEPKSKSLTNICIEISYRMQENLVLGIELETVQEIVKKITGNTNALHINMIVQALVDLFFEKSNNNDVEILLYKHRRFHEYFLYKKVDENFLEQPQLLRELHLLSNKDFVINVFMKTSLNKAYKEKNILKALALRILEQNLGYTYWHNYSDNLIGKRLKFGSTEPFYSSSSSLIHLMASYDTKDIEAVLSNEELSIGDCINKDNCLELIELHHKIRNSDISELIFSKCTISKDKLITYRNCYSYFYIRNKIKNVPLKKMYDNLCKNIKFLNPEIKHMDYVESSNEALSTFYRYCLDQDVEFVTDLISDMSKEQLELLSFQLFKYNNILCLVSKIQKYNNLQQEFINRFEKENENYFINTIAVYSFLSNNKNKLPQLKEALDKVNCRNFPTWHRNIELHNVLCYLLKNEVNYTLNEFKLGVSLFTHLVENIDNLNEVLKLWIEDIKPYNFVWNDWLKYTYSNMLGTLISNIQFDIIELKKFLRELMKYESVIYMPTVYYNILKYNYRLFNQISNEQIFDRLIELTMTGELEFDNSCEYFFQFAAMYLNINKEKSYSLLIDGINNETLRPQYNGEQLMSMIMPGCLYFAYENYLYDDFEIKELFAQLYSNLSKLKNTTQNDGPFDCLKWAIKTCIHDEEDDILKYLYNESEFELYPRKNKKTGNCFDVSKVTEESLRGYYSFKYEGIPYDSLEFWIKIIDINYKLDPELKILYECFKEIYPSRYGYNPIIDCIYLPVAVLLSDERTKEKFTEFIMDYAGEYGFYNIIRAYSIIGKVNEGRKCIGFLFKYINMLTAPISNLLSSKKPIQDKSLFTLSTIYNSIKDDWYFFEDKCTCMLRSNHKIKIVWDSFEGKRAFHEKWATNHCDDKAYISDYYIYDGDIEIKRFSLVDVDGYRAILPIPKRNTNIIKRSDYFLSRLFNERIETLHEYIILSDLIVD
ncbi:NACHT domain-containing protein [Clostridium paraputrificum]|uniref:NACHT domain-containing protein n=1 Tax=Clostridium paraputrificum TaxID=29363 RepID=UPI003D330C09